MSLFKIECLLDYTHDYTSSVNDWLKDNSGAKNALLIIGGLMSDGITLATLGIWTWKGKTWRLPLALIFIYVAKALTSVSSSKLAFLTLSDWFFFGLHIGIIQVSVPGWLPLGEPWLLLANDSVRRLKRHALHSARLPSLRDLPRASHGQTVHARPYRILRFYLPDMHGLIHTRRIHHRSVRSVHLRALLFRRGRTAQLLHRCQNIWTNILRAIP